MVFRRPNGRWAVAVYRFFPHVQRSQLRVVTPYKGDSEMIDLQRQPRKFRGLKTFERFEEAKKLSDTLENV